MTTTFATAGTRTTVRPVDAFRLTALRGAFAALERLAPGVGARWALRLWCTLPSNGGRRRDERPWAGERTILTLPGNRSVVVETWGAGEPVYLVHGWGGWRGQLGAFVAPLLDAGRRVVAFDTPSHGESPPGHLGPRRSTAVEVAEAFAAVAAVHGAPSAVVAHSLGCTTSAVAEQDGLAIDRLALIAPNPDVLSLTENLANTLGYGARTRRRFDDRLEAVARRPLTDFDLTAMNRDAPTLIVHDRADKEVPYAQGARLAETWSGADLLATEGLGHQRILRDAGVIGEITKFLTA